MYVLISSTLNVFLRVVSIEPNIDLNSCQSIRNILWYGQPNKQKMPEPFCLNLRTASSARIRSEQTFGKHNHVICSQAGSACISPSLPTMLILEKSLQVRCTARCNAKHFFLLFLQAKMYTAGVNPSVKDISILSKRVWNRVPYFEACSNYRQVSIIVFSIQYYRRPGCSAHIIWQCHIVTPIFLQLWSCEAINPRHTRRSASL